MSTDDQEQLIQRAIDGELSGEQRRTLLDQCDRSEDGWKSLACAFLEEQLIREAVGDGSGLYGDHAAEPVVPVQPATRIATHWYHYPAIAVPLTMCTAFLLGMLMPWDVFSERSSPSQTTPFNVTSAVDGPRRSDSPGGALDRGNGSPRTELELQALRRQMWEIQQMLDELRRDQFMNEGLKLFPLEVPSP